MNAHQTFAERVISFNKNLHFTDQLPDGFKVLNPFEDNPEVVEVMEKFYTRFYSDTQTRKFIIGINPGRHGAGATGVPFSDTKRLQEYCGITMKTVKTHEVSSVFVYDLITYYGGVDEFYKKFYINSPFPLAIVQKTTSGSWLNANYYDSKTLFEAVSRFMVQTVKQHINLGIDTSEVVVLGKKNAEYIKKFNAAHHFFNEIHVLDHPRYIQQYKSKEKAFYLDSYLQTLHQL